VSKGNWLAAAASWVLEDASERAGQVARGYERHVIGWRATNLLIGSEGSRCVEHLEREEQREPPIVWTAQARRRL